MRGRKPTPTKLKLLRGNPGKRKLPREPEPQSMIPDCPPHLDALARAEWQRIVPELAALNLLTGLDRAALAAYCQAWSRWIAAEQQLQAQGAVILAPSGYPIQNPQLAIANKALAQLRAFAAEFGLSPASRSRVAAPTSPKKDDLDTLLGA
jgi:P27 family predicted phage terminase small subunit